MYSICIVHRFEPQGRRFAVVVVVVLVVAVVVVVVSVSGPDGFTYMCGDVAVYAFDINQSSLPTPLYSVLASVSVFTALSNVFHSTNSLDNSSLSHSVLLILILPHRSFQLYISL